MWLCKLRRALSVGFASRTEMAGMDRVVVDTNVLAVAEGLHDDASEGCVAAAVALVSKIHSGLRVVVDADGEILREYLKALEVSKESGVGKKRMRSLPGSGRGRLPRLRRISAASWRSRN
jgi:hypothetical protein